MQDQRVQVEKLGEKWAAAETRGDTIEAKAGQTLVVPAGVPYKYVNSGAGRAGHIDIHTSGRMSTEWLEEWNSPLRGRVLDLSGAHKPHHEQE